MIGIKMREKRLQLGWTRAELASGLMTEQTLVNYESGRTSPTIDKVLKLARKLGVTVEEYTGVATAYSFDEYARNAKRTAPDLDKYAKLVNASLGMCGEAGEFADLVKKFCFQGHDLDEDHLIRELGDILWYIAQAADALNVDLSIVAERNIAKLKARYPDGFKASDSLNRAEGDI